MSIMRKAIQCPWWGKLYNGHNEESYTMAIMRKAIQCPLWGKLYNGHNEESYSMSIMRKAIQLVAIMRKAIEWKNIRSYVSHHTKVCYYARMTYIIIWSPIQGQSGHLSASCDTCHTRICVSCVSCVSVYLVGVVRHI